MAAADLAEARKGRWAVAAMFMMNGFLMGSWAVQIPELVTRFGISETTLGMLIVGFGVGALAMMPAAGMLMARYGSQHVLRLLAAACVFALLPVALAPNVPFVAVALFLLGGLTGSMDVAMNANAVAVEKKLNKAIMSASHGFWSLGGFLGGGVAGYAIKHYGYFAHIMGVTVVAALAVALAWRFVLADEPAAAKTEKKQPMRLPANPAIYLVGILALFAMIPEGAVMDWSALYLRKELGADIATAGLAYSFFAGAMATLRFLGDRVRDRFGAVTTLRVSSLIAASGILVGALAPNAWVAIFAFAFSGIGIANIVPIAFSAGGNQPGVSASTGMAVVTTMGYSGILLAPSLVGYFAEHFGFSAVFTALALMLVVVCLLAPLARGADFKRTPPLPGPETF